jgi:hypothetical protein
LGFEEVVCHAFDTFRAPFSLDSFDNYRKILEYEPAGHIWMSLVETLQIMTPASTDIDKQNGFVVLPRPWAKFCGHWECFMPIHQTLPANGHVVIQIVSLVLVLTHVLEHRAPVSKLKWTLLLWLLWKLMDLGISHILHEFCTDWEEQVEARVISKTLIASDVGHTDVFLLLTGPVYR